MSSELESAVEEFCTCEEGRACVPHRILARVRDASPPAQPVAALVEEAERLDASATPGPWTIGDGLLKNEAGLYVGPTRVMVGALKAKGRDYCVASTGPVNSADSHSDAAFIARARTLLPALAAEGRRLSQPLTEEERATVAEARRLVEGRLSRNTLTAQLVEIIARLTGGAR